MELLSVVDAVAREKNIDRMEVMTAMESAIQKAGRDKYGAEYDIRAVIDRKTGRIKLARYREVVAEIIDENTEINLEMAVREKPDAAVGDFLIDELPPIDFGRVAAQNAKQIIVQKMRESERSKMVEEFKDRVGEVVNGIVSRVEYGNVIVNLGRGEGQMRREESLPREHFKIGDRIRAYIYSVDSEVRGSPVLLSRTHPQFMAKLFMQEVPEIYDGVIQVKSVARDPGSRAKIAVYSNDPTLDPVGACVGMRGSRVQAVVNELGGERVDIVPWSDDPARLVINALAPAQISKVVLDEVNRKIEVVIPDEQLSQAIGRRGQNVKLASILTGLDIDVLTEAEEAERRAKEFRDRSAHFMETLDVDDVIAHLLVAEGFVSVEDVIDSTVEEVASIEGFDSDVALELITRANGYVTGREQAIQSKIDSLAIGDDLMDMGYFDTEMLIKLGEAGVKTANDLGDLSSDELIDILGAGSFNEAEASAIIMEIRAKWFEAEDDGEGDDFAGGVSS